MADDDEEDCFLANEAFFESRVQATLSFVGDGNELIDYLVECSRSEACGLPRLILLDLNMPRKDGRQALLEIKAEPSLQHIPIVILTTSGEAEDVCFAMKAGASSFITKPASFDEWIKIMESLPGLWGEE